MKILLHILVCLSPFQGAVKLRDRKGRAKYCAGMGSYPRNYIKLMNEFNNLFGVDIKHHIR